MRCFNLLLTILMRNYEGLSGIYDISNTFQGSGTELIHEYQQIFRRNTNDNT